MANMKLQVSFSMVVVVLASLAMVIRGNPVKDTNGLQNGNPGGLLNGEELAMRTLSDSNEESLNRFINDPMYRAGYERAVYDLYAGRFRELPTENTYSAPSKKNIDLGLGRFNSGSRAANSLMALDSARFAGGPGRK